MDPILLLSLAAAAVLVLLAAKLRRGRARPAAAAAASKPAEALDTLSAWEPQGTRVLTLAELRAMQALHRALPEHYVLAQVPLARFIRVPTRRSYTEWLRRVGQLSPDLLVCDATSQVVAAIEIRPPQAQASQRAQTRLERMRKVLKAAGITLHVWPEGVLPNPQTIREVILAGTPPAPIEAAPAAATAARPAAAPAAPAPSAAKPVPAHVLAQLDFDDEYEADEVIEMREAPPSTWFDELEATRASGSPTLRPTATAASR